MKISKYLLYIIAIISFTGCTDAAFGKLKAYNGQATILCYSAEKLIFEGTSTGKIKSESNSDGYYFVDAKDGKLKEVSGNCVIEYQSY